MIDQLVARLTAANEAYRNGCPIMSDALYDALEDELRTLDPKNPYLRQVGAPANSAWEKTAHKIPMGSLSKAQFDPSVQDGHSDLRRWWPVGQAVHLSEKLDGISVSLFYEDRKLRQAVTRGDGLVGEDITRNVVLMEGVPKTLPVGSPQTLYVRGEILCRRSSFKEFFPGESNPRNTAAGTAKRRDSVKANHLTVVAYQYLPNGESTLAKSGEISALVEAGFITPQTRVVHTLSEAIARYEEYIVEVRESLDWDIDGLVFDIEDHVLRESLGVQDGRPRGAIALKFPHAQTQSVLRAVYWQVGRSGRITPVAEFDAVDLGGVSVTRASLHNLDQIALLCEEASLTQLKIGSGLLVSRRNDVIPAVEAVLTSGSGPEVAGPTHCPECNSLLARSGAYLVCENTDLCPAQVSGSIKRWVDKIGVKNFGPALIDLLCQTGYIETLPDLYRIDPSEIERMEDPNGRRVGGIATKAFANLHAVKQLPLHVFVGSLGIPLVGRTTAKVLVDAGVNTLKAMSYVSIAEIEGISGIGTAKAQAFVSGFRDLLARGVITGLLRHVQVSAQVQGVLTGKSVCMTGFRDSDMETAVEANGGALKSGVSKGLDYLVALDPTGTSGKLEKARQYGTKVVSPAEMWALLGKV